MMTVKELLRRVARDLPEDASIEEAWNRLLFLHKVERGLEQADRGDTIPHSRVEKDLEKWLR